MIFALVLIIPQIVFFKEIGETCGTSQSETINTCSSSTEGKNITCCLLSYSMNSKQIKECRILLNESPATLYNSYISIVKSFPKVVTESTYDCGTKYEQCLKRVPSKKEECTDISVPNPFHCCYMTYNLDSLCFPIDIKRINKFANKFQHNHSLNDPPSIICNSYCILYQFFILMLFLFLL